MRILLEVVATWSATSVAAGLLVGRWLHAMQAQPVRVAVRSNTSRAA